MTSWPDGGLQLSGVTLGRIDLPPGPHRLLWAGAAEERSATPILLIDHAGGRGFAAYALRDGGAKRISRQFCLHEALATAKHVLRGHAEIRKDFRTLNLLAAAVVAMGHFADPPLRDIDLPPPPDADQKRTREIAADAQEDLL